MVREMFTLNSFILNLYFLNLRLREIFMSAVTNVPVLLHEVKEIQAKTDFILQQAQGSGPEREQLALNIVKVGAIKIAEKLSQISQYYYSEGSQEKLAESYWKKSVEVIKKYQYSPAKDKKVDYNTWLNLSTLYCQRIQLSVRQVIILDRPEKIKLLKEGLDAINSALRIEETSDTIFQKFLLLQLLEEVGVKSSENPLVWLKRYLDTHSDLNSDDYIHYANLYGDRLANTGRLEEAVSWFQNLLSRNNNAISYLYLGKIEDQQSHFDAALPYFEKAQALDPENKEIQLWLLSARVKEKIQKFRAANQIPTQEEIDEWVMLCNRFCQTFSSEEMDGDTSTFIPLVELAQRLFMKQVPEVALTLAHLQQYSFALYLYESILLNIQSYRKEGMIDFKEEVKLHTTLGGLYTQQQRFEEAESHLLQALELYRATEQGGSSQSEDEEKESSVHARSVDTTALGIYKNLAAVYACQSDKDKLSALWDQLKPELDGIARSNPGEAVSGLLFNFGTAYALSAKGPDDPDFEQAKPFYRLSLKYDPNNWDTRIHLARVLAIQANSDQWSEAKELLTGFEEYESTLPFGISPPERFRFYFYFSGVLALCQKIEEAKKAAIEAGKTRADPEKVLVLQSFLNNVRGVDHPTLCTQIRESLAKLDFPVRIGKFVNPQSILIPPNTIVGYHGTTDAYISEFQEGIKPRSSESNQFKGNGFYIAKDKEIASYFAMKKVREEGRGNPVLLTIYSCQKELVGHEVEPHSKLKKDVSVQYDFIQAPIDGFEKYPQLLVFEKSCKLIRPSADFERVEWSEDEYQEFIKGWTRSSC